ncbi:MAG TPA: metallophosphoesterase family protein [Polyangia bacterium]
MRWLVAVGCALSVATAPVREARAAEHLFVADGAPARMHCGAAPAGWQRPELDDRDWNARPTQVERRDSGAPVEVEPPAEAARLDGGGADGARVDGGRGGLDGGIAACAGPRFARWHFAVGAELPSLKSLTLRIRYTHGFAAYINGAEIARRRLDPGAPPDALASDVHGPEYESFTVPARVLHRGDNLLAVEVHPHTAGRDTTIELSLRGDEGARLVRGPYLLGLREREATIVFDTPTPTSAEVRWGHEDDYGSAAHDGFGTHHVIRLTTLKPGTVYHYRVRVRPTVGTSSDGELDAGDAIFHTPPDGGRPLRFAVYGDVRSGHDVHAALDQTLADEQPDFAILTGDLVDRGSDEGDWERFFEIAGPLLRTLSIYPAIGNHEYASRGKGLVAFMQYFRWPLALPDDEPPWYSFDIGGAHFVALDSNSYKSPRQLSWFDRDLREARRRGARALFVYAHEGPASSGMHGDNMICARDYVPVMERYHVAMFFGGHDHDFERGRIGALDYVVTGGGGAELRSARCGVPGKRACPSRVATFANDHNYVMVELLPSLFRVCPKRVDGTPIEACTQYPLR